MTLVIPTNQLTGASLAAAWGELLDSGIESAALRCGYVDVEHQTPDIESFIAALKEAHAETI